MGSNVLASSYAAKVASSTCIATSRGEMAAAAAVAVAGEAAGAAGEHPMVSRSDAVAMEMEAPKRMPS